MRLAQSTRLMREHKQLDKQQQLFSVLLQRSVYSSVCPIFVV